MRCADPIAHRDAFHCWRRKFGALQIPDARRLPATEKENRRPKSLVADPPLNLQGVKDLLGPCATGQRPAGTLLQVRLEGRSAAPVGLSAAVAGPAAGADAVNRKRVQRVYQAVGLQVL